MMPIKALARGFTKTTQKIPLRLVLVVPFVVQIFAAVVLTGYFSLRNGQQAVKNIAGQLSREVTARIEQHLNSYLEKPAITNQVTLDALELGLINLQEAESIERFFWKQIQSFNSVNTIQFGSEQEEYIGAGRTSDSQLVIKIAGSATGKEFRTYATDQAGNRSSSQIVPARANYNPKKRPWYIGAVEAKKNIWSPIYVMFSHKGLGITLAQPVYNNNQELLGVIGTDILLSEISDFLNSLKVGKTGQTFIMERSGHLVATSSQQQLFEEKDGKNERLQAIDSQSPLIKATATHLKEKFGDFRNIKSDRPLPFNFKGKQQFLQVFSFQDEFGLDWLIVVVVPEQDFLAQINKNTRTTILLCLAALGMATIVGIFTSGWIGKPILQLSEASGKIANGELDQVIEVKSINELRTLAKSFNQMAAQLQESFAALEKTNEELERRVEERTAALREKEQYLRLILDNIPQQVFWKDIDLVFRGCNQNWAKAAGVDDPEAIVGKTDYDLLPNREVADHYRDQDRRIIDNDLPELHLTEFKQKPSSNGETIIMDLNKLPIHDYEGKVVGILGVLEDITQRKLAEKALIAEQEKSERLLLNILPKAIAERLKQDTSAIAEQFDEATILFADIVGFTPLSAGMSPKELVNLLNDIFSIFDKLAEKHDLEKIKTVGDEYMVVGGLPVPKKDHAEAIAQMALDMQEAIKNFDRSLNSSTKFSGKLNKSFQMRIGINTGPVVAGVIGIKKFAYDLWGDTVNVASRMESSGVPGKIQVTEETYQRLKDKYVLVKRGKIAVKGKGKMITYWLKESKE